MRTRQVRGPQFAGGTPALLVIAVRRYRCTECGATMTVVPMEVLTRRLYSAAAIAWALALFGVVGQSMAKVRERVSPWRVVGATSSARWESLARWTAAVARGALWRCVRAAPLDWPPRRVAERAASTIAAYALPSPEPPPLDVLAFFGAAHAA